MTSSVTSNWDDEKPHPFNAGKKRSFWVEKRTTSDQGGVQEKQINYTDQLKPSTGS